MSTQASKTTTKPAAKKATASAAKKASNAAETVVTMNNKAMEDFQKSIGTEAQKAQEKLAEFGRESAEQLSQSANSASEAMGDIMNICRDNVEACMESGNIAASICKEVSEEVAEQASRSSADAVEFSKSLLSCRTLNDVVELQNNLMKSTMDGYFEQCSQVAGAMFEAANEVAEPINQRIAEASEEVSRIIAKK